MASGTESAWTMLAQLPPDEVCTNAGVARTPAGDAYLLRCFGREITVRPGRREMTADTPAGESLLGRFRYFSELAILWYLASAKAVPLSGKLIRPSDLKAGQIFATGSHVLPLDKLAQKYGTDPQAFLARGSALGGEPAPGLGDVAVRLLPFPRVPVVLVLWKECEEFRARTDLLFDSTCELQLPQDIIWATAMLSCLIML
ncbi:MAG: DUF3786 domain-containing protein [Syntrophales bacterium]